MSDVYDIMAELLIEGHGDKTDSLYSWYQKYSDKGLTYAQLRQIFVRNGYLKDKKGVEDESR